MTFNVIQIDTSGIEREAGVIFEDKSYHNALEALASYGDHFEVLVPLGSVPPVLAPYGVKQAWELRDDNEKVALLAIQEVDDDVQH